MDVHAAHYSAVCPVCGMEVLSPGAETGLTPQATIGILVVVLPEHGRAPGVKHGSIHEVIFSGQNGNVFIAYEDARPVRQLGTHVSLWSVGFLTDGRAWWHSGATNWSVDDEPPHSRKTPGGAVSNMGCLGNPERPENWLLGYPPPVFHGERLFNPSYDGNWVVGQAAEELIHLAYHVPTDTLWDAGPTHGSPVASRVIVVDGGPAIVCRSYPSGLIHQRQFTPYEAEPIEPPIEPPIIEPPIEPPVKPPIKPPKPVEPPIEPPIPPPIEESEPMKAVALDTMIFTTAETVPHQDAGFVAIKKANGLYVSCDDFGNISERPEEGDPNPGAYKPGAAERFEVSGSTAFAVRGEHTYVFPMVG